MDRVTMGLLSMIRVLGTIPIIRSATGYHKLYISPYVRILPLEVLHIHYLQTV